jgi:hypothetical protein
MSPQVEVRSKETHVENHKQLAMKKYNLKHFSSSFFFLFLFFFTHPSNVHTKSMNRGAVRTLVPMMMMMMMMIRKKFVFSDDDKRSKIRICRRNAIGCAANIDAEINGGC